MRRDLRFWEMRRCTWKGGVTSVEVKWLMYWIPPDSLDGMAGVS
jgi:hypothetical protein